MQPKIAEFCYLQPKNQETLAYQDTNFYTITSLSKCHRKTLVCPPPAPAGRHRLPPPQAITRHSKSPSGVMLEEAKQGAWTCILLNGVKPHIHLALPSSPGMNGQTPWVEAGLLPSLRKELPSSFSLECVSESLVESQAFQHLPWVTPHSVNGGHVRRVVRDFYSFPPAMEASWVTYFLPCAAALRSFIPLLSMESK